MSVENCLPASRIDECIIIARMQNYPEGLFILFICFHFKTKSPNYTVLDRYYFSLNKEISSSLSSGAYLVSFHGTFSSSPITALGNSEALTTPYLHFSFLICVSLIRKVQIGILVTSIVTFNYCKYK